MTESDGETGHPRAAIAIDAASGGPAVRFGRQFMTFLAVGAGNTLFGFASYAALTFLLDGLVPFHYVAASLAASVVNVTVSFLAYKWVVFRTRGNYFSEWLRAIVVYGSTIVFGAASLPPLVFLAEHMLPRPELAPYLAGAALIVGQAMVSFFAHRRFTFRRD